MSERLRGRHLYVAGDPEVEACNGADDNCDGSVDEGCGETIYVGSGEAYDVIQDAIDFLPDDSGSTIIVRDGIYDGFIVDISGLIVKADPLADAVIINTIPSGKDSGVHISTGTDNATVSGFTFDGINGVYVDDASSIILNENIFDNATTYGVKVVGLYNVDARVNYWGDISGPDGGVTDNCTGGALANGDGAIY